MGRFPECINGPFSILKIAWKTAHEEEAHQEVLDDRPHVPHFRYFGCVFAVFPVFCSMPGVDPHVPLILWIECEENWDDWICQGWVWVQPKYG